MDFHEKNKGRAKMTEDMIPTYSRVARDGMAIVVVAAPATGGAPVGAPGAAPQRAGRPVWSAASTG